MKPSLRRDSLAQKKPGRLGDIEKAARKEATRVWHQILEGVSLNPGFPTDQISPTLYETLLRFAHRHGAKVRRETWKEALEQAADLIETYQGIPPVSRRVIRAAILSLTPRGPEKGRTR